MLMYTEDLALSLGFTNEDCEGEQFLQVFSGNELLTGMKPFAMCYGGHQFGNWAGQLGDGRAITLGELRDSNGNLQSLQLKGAGKTPYSRSADGLAVLRSSVREFVCSEAMFYLGVPTTRALTLVATGDAVVRDMLYDGNPAPEPGAIVCRVSPSFVRFGNFEILAAQRNFQLLRKLADHTIRNHYDHLTELEGAEKYVTWFEEVQDRTIDMTVHWMRTGFVHGVMNTDNMSVLGLTIDYGPYGWLEDYDPDWTPNTTDASTRRYRYGQQPWIAQWNLLQFANAIVPLIGKTEQLENALNRFPATYQARWEQTVLEKLGVHGDLDGVAPLVQELESVLKLTELDYTLFFRGLAKVKVDSQNPPTELGNELHSAMYDPSSLDANHHAQLSNWLSKYIQVLKHQNQDGRLRVERMHRKNPLYVPRNYLAQLAIDAIEDGDISFLTDWMKVLQDPYREQPDKEKFAAKRPEWARTRVGCSMLSCSS